MNTARIGYVIAAGMVLEVRVGGLLVLETLMPDQRLLLRALMLLVVAVQVIVFAHWIVDDRPVGTGSARPSKSRVEAQAGALWLGSEERR